MISPAAATFNKDLAAAGFLCLGGFEPDANAGMPEMQGDERTKALLLIGSTGPSLWPVFTRSTEYSDDAPHALDRYTKRVLTDLANTNGFRVLFPFEGPPYYPFQQWAIKCGGFSQSPMGVLAHRDYGPWSGFRAVFLSPDRQPHFIGPATMQGPCETCQDKPCLSVCPANALSREAGYDVPSCRAHLEATENAECLSGCLARRACPFGAEHQQEAATARFHMRSFLGF
ncbi:MAG: hypothetical protein K5905_27535 [Roseibium sp.]|uniref:hypothetical protein n=1 Tax=Roseibium sp. TaxID=1936156 RepID=UPI002602A6F5|nr:hypothetical protein [Roseibium sp.]MCV0429220.1 hypothetical protein [Roseibium sp.]